MLRKSNLLTKTTDASAKVQACLLLLAALSSPASADKPRLLSIHPETAGVRLSVAENFRCANGAFIRIDVLSTAVFSPQPADQVSSRASLANFDASAFANLALVPLMDASGSFRCNLHSIDRKIETYFNGALIGAVNISSSTGQSNVTLDITNKMPFHSSEQAAADHHFNRIWTISRILSERDAAQRKMLNGRLQNITQILRAEKDRALEIADANNDIRRVSPDQFRASVKDWISTAERLGHPILQYAVAQRLYHTMGIGAALLERRDHDADLARRMFRLYRLSANQDFLFAVQQLKELRELGIVVDQKGVATQSEEPNEIEIHAAINTKLLSGCNFAEVFSAATGAAQSVSQVTRDKDWCVARQPILGTQMKFRISPPSEISCGQTSTGSWDCRYMASVRCFAIVPNFPGTGDAETACPPPMNFLFPFRSEYRRNKGVGLEFVRPLN
jgi:hypothetical protein